MTKTWLSSVLVQFLCSVARHSTVQYSTLYYSTLHFSTVQYSIVQSNTVQYRIVQYSTVQYSKVQHSTVQYITVQYRTVQYSRVYYSLVLQGSGGILPFSRFTVIVIKCSAESSTRTFTVFLSFAMDVKHQISSTGVSIISTVSHQIEWIYQTTYILLYMGQFPQDGNWLWNMSFF